MPSKNDHYDVADSTDWLETPFAVLAPVEAALRCQVCKDFYTTPMITSCSHTFCSMCIRRCLSNDGRCPTCRSSEQALKLRSNGNMEEAVDAFQRARAVMLQHARTLSSIGSSASPKRKAAEIEMGDEGDTARKKTRASTRLAQRHADTNLTALSDGEQGRYDDEDNEDGDYSPEDARSNGNVIVACPICSSKMRMEKINSHIDTCTGVLENTTSAVSTSGISSSKPSLPVPPRKFERLPQLSYSLLKESALRKKLSELGISTNGSRQLLEKRHAEWVTLWNANCDSKRPRKKSELLHNLEIWERTQGTRVASSSNGINLGSQILSKDFDGPGWAAKHDQSFQQLIQQARSKVKLKNTPDTPETSKDDGSGSASLQVGENGVGAAGKSPPLETSDDYGKGLDQGLNKEDVLGHEKVAEQGFKCNEVGSILQASLSVANPPD